jgi:hypothetical protein
MHDSLAVLVITKRLEGQGLEEGFFFCEHGRDLPFGGAVDARIGAVGLPTIQIGLGFFQTLEAFSLEWSFLRVTDSGFNFAFAIGILDAAGQRHNAIVCENVAIERIQRRVVEIWSEYTFF